MNKFWLLHTAWRLGAVNCLRVAAYKACVKLGVYRKRMPIGQLSTFGDTLRAAEPRLDAVGFADPEALLGKAERLLRGELEYFGAHWWNVGSPPDWFLDPWTGKRWSARLHWSETDEFALGLDIKSIWEPSRFEWAVLLARAYSLTADRTFLDTLCSWLDSWVQENPLNAGPNWKCGQETSIRLLRLLEALNHIDCSHIDSKPLVVFIAAHLERIAATLSYALGQDNNHGTSEAAALFVGGHWLRVRGSNSEIGDLGQRMARLGERQLNERVERLVSQDGTFSQYSLNYHRLFLDTMSVVEVWSRRFNLSSPLRSCEGLLHAACDWLYSMVDPATGDAPNIGGNDGALLLISPATSFRDYRPTLQLAGCLFRSERAYPAGPWDDACRAWGVEPSEFGYRDRRQKSAVFMPGGFITLVAADGRSRAVLRVPSFRFRPSQADALHLDLWAGSKNVVRDAGTYSYNADRCTHNYFSGVEGHSTCQFDSHDQMPRIGRFLFARWLECDEVPEIVCHETEQEVTVSYTDFTGCRHRRKVSERSSQWIVADEVHGFSQQAVIRWRLSPEHWEFSTHGVSSPTIRLEVSSASDFETRLLQGCESRWYLQKTPAPVFEIVVKPPGGVIRTIITVI